MTKVEISNTKTTFKDLAVKIEKTRKLTAIKLNNVTIEGSERDMIEMSKSVRGQQDLEDFELTNITVVDAEVNMDQVVSVLLVTCPELETVVLEKAPVSASALACIAYCDTVKNIMIPNCGWTDADAAKIAPAVAQNKSIVRIDIAGNDLSDTGCVAFAEAVNTNTGLKEVNLGGNGKISGSELNKIQGTLSKRAGAGAQAA